MPFFIIFLFFIFTLGSESVDLQNEIEDLKVSQDKAKEQKDEKIASLERLNIKLEDYITRGDTSYLKIIGKGRALDTPESIAIPPQTTALINDYLKERRVHKRTCPYLFCNLNDGKLTRQAVNKAVKKIAKEYDKIYNTNIAPRVSTHTFRHSLARYLLVEKGVPINQVKDILRHSNIETTAKYLTTTQEEITEIRKAIIF